MDSPLRGSPPGESPLKPRKTTREQVYEAIKAAILEGKMEISSRVTEATLVEWLGVSRTPIREAFGRLEQEGWIKQLPTGGYIISPVDLDEAFYIYRARATLEGVLVRDACRNITPEQCVNLERLTHELEKSVELRDANSLARTGRDIHSFIADLSADGVSKRLLQLINDRVELYRSLTVQFEQRQDEVREEHRQIAQAMLRSDPDLAQREMQKHIERAGMSLIEVLRAGSLPDNHTG